MSNIRKALPLKGEFTRVQTSVRPDEYGVVEERTKDKITIRFKNDVVGIYNIENNIFERVNIQGFVNVLPSNT